MASQSPSNGIDEAAMATMPSTPPGDVDGDEATTPSGEDSDPSQEQTGPPRRVRANTLMLERGEVLAGRYEILDHIGAGGMGHVYKARQTTIRKVVAIKTLSKDFSAKPELVDRFLQEARAASLIRHPNIVDITDFGHAENGTPFIAMEYLEGEDLGDTLEREKRLSWGRARAMMKQILSALQAAHDRGVIHRDMKPENCFRVSLDDNPDFIKVVDFGIAKVQATEGETDDGLTKTGAVMGTASYMSPEQAKSLPLDARADVYSAGVILYQLLTGSVPFKANGFVAVLYKHIAEPPEPPRKRAPDAGITREMEAVVLKALAKDPDDRYQSAQAFYEAIRDVNEEAGAGRGRPSGVLVAGLVATLLLVGGGVAWGAGVFGGAAGMPGTAGTGDAAESAVTEADEDQAVIDAANELLDSEKLDAAIAAIEEHFGSDTQHPGAREMLARVHFKVASNHWARAEYAEALAAYQLSHELHASPLMSYNIAQAHEELGNYDEAIEQYQTYLDQVPDAKDRKRVERTIKRLEELQAAQAALAEAENEPPVDLADPALVIADAGSSKTKSKTKVATKAKPATKPDSAIAEAGPADSLDAASIKRALAGAKSKALACGKKFSALPGTKVSVQIDVDAAGNVRSAKAQAPFATNPLGACVSGVAEKLKFPESKSGKKFKYSFTVAK